MTPAAIVSDDKESPATGATITIEQANTPETIDAARYLMRAFAEMLDCDHGVSLAFQNIDEELANLPKPYSHILLAKYQAATSAAIAPNRPASWPYVGVVALKALPHLGPEYCELKRLYILPEARGIHMGEALCTRLIEIARLEGYRHMMLDSLDRLSGALRLYDKLGFQKTYAYCHNPFFDAAYRQKDL